MSIVLEDEPLVLEETLQSIQCGYTWCDERATWSVIWSCGETTTYCDEHRKWAQRESDADGVHCDCTSVPRTIHLVVVVPL